MKILFTLWMNILNFQKVKYTYIRFGLIFESLSHAGYKHVCVCSILLYLLICTLDLFVYITQLHECTNVCLLHSYVVNYCLVQ